MGTLGLRKLNRLTLGHTKAVRAHEQKTELKPDELTLKQILSQLECKIAFPFHSVCVILFGVLWREGMNPGYAKQTMAKCLNQRRN